ncbi:MAG: cysteine desulfurase family protein [Candidatus Acidiferrales bacterium]
MRVYLDYNATTPMAPEVLDAMMPYFSERFANASSIHSEGQRARYAVEGARESVAGLIGAKAAEIVFTSGGTEADNLAIFGAIAAAGATNAEGKRHVITSAIEHHAVLNACQKLERDGVEVTYVGAGADGIVDAEEVRRALRPSTILISIMHANNELGTIQPIAAIGEIAREAGVAFHTDAVQAVGKLPVDVGRLGVNLLSLSAHKIYGPKGMGALYVKAGTRLHPMFFGGHHERDKRPGTENVAGIVGLGRAAESARALLSESAARIAGLRDRFESRILEMVPQCRVNGDRSRRVANTTNITFAGAEGESLVIALDLRGVACSTGAACSSGAVEPSHVLTAIGLTPEEGRSSVRFSLGRTTLDAEIDFAVNAVRDAVGHLREISPTYRKTAGVR